MDASQLRYPESVHSVPKHNFVSFYLSKVSEILRNATKHHFGSNGEVWQLWYPEIVHWGSDASFASYYLSKVSEILWNTPKHQFGSNGVDWMLHNFGTPKRCIQARNTSFASFFQSKVSEMLQNTPKHHFGSNEVEWMLHNFGTRNSAFSPETQVLHLFTCRRLVKYSKTLPNITLGPMEMFHDFGTLK
jgi:hypothetical protein